MMEAELDRSGEEVALSSQAGESSTSPAAPERAAGPSPSSWPARRLALAGLGRRVLAPSRLLAAAELLFVFAWALLVAGPYLNFDPTVIPAGREYLSGIQTHHLWQQVQTCGACAFWNGSTRGGAPAFVDPHGSALHPMVMLTTLAWGVLNGSKAGLVAAFFMAGLAQWSLARVLAVSLPARLWSAAMAVVAGNLAARMELGLFGVVLSTAACALVLAPIVAVTKTGGRRAAVLLGITLALAAVAGQGYMQLGLIFSLVAVLILVPWQRDHLARLGRRFVLAAGLAFLLAAPFLVPFVHFLPQFGKETDPSFASAQPFAYVPLNLVVDDAGFYNSDALQKLPYPHLYANYVGWIPLLFALLALYGIRTRSEARIAGFLVVWALIALWIASAAPLRWLAEHLPIPWLAAQFAGIRHPPQIAGLAVPAVLALAALGLDRLLAAPWLRLRVGLGTPEEAGRDWWPDLRWLLVIPALLALSSAWSFGRNWIRTEPLPPTTIPVLEALRTPDLQWTNPPFGEHFYIERAVAMGLKMHFGIRTWHWRDRPLPEPVLEANTQGPPPGMTQQNVADGVPIYAAAPGREYATVAYADGSAGVCTAHGSGGHIDVTCDAHAAGIATIKENNWSGWRAAVDGRPAAIRPGQWLAVELPAGTHTIRLRYRPWDVPLGLAMCLAGIALAVYHWRRGDARLAPPMS